MKLAAALAAISLAACTPGQHLTVVRQGSIATLNLAPTRQECEQQGESIGCPRTSDNSQCAPYDDICLDRRSLEEAARAQDTERKRQVAAAAEAQADEIRNKQAQVEEAAGYARPVGAPDWYILSDRTKVCFRAYDMAKANGAPALRSPDAWQTFERDAGVFLNLRTTRDANGQVAMAEVISMRIPESVYFFSTKQYCEEQRSLWLANGIITDPKELK